MSEQLYSDAGLYDRLFPAGEQAVDLYTAEADTQGGNVLELGCGTGHKLIPIASDGHRCRGTCATSARAERSTSETYDAAAQVTHGRWYFSTDVESDFVVAPLEIRSIFPRSCRCCSRSVVSGLSNASATGPVRH